MCLHVAFVLKMKFYFHLMKLLLGLNMILRLIAKYTLLIILLFFIPNKINGQPALPNMSAVIENNSIKLVWFCKYDSVKSIAVKHSTDSSTNYTIIGYVKKTELGFQSYIDEHPNIGRNFYKVTLEFSSSLKWTSNMIGIHFVENSLKKDSTNIKHLESNFKKESDFNSKEQKYIQKQTTITPDTLIKKSLLENNVIKKPTIKYESRIAINFIDTICVNPSQYIIPRYLITDSVGEININLPEDINSHIYTMKFYNENKQKIYDIVKFNTAKLIMDKRNFRNSGLYMFLLKKDGLELERGYFNIE